ncbi:hypothetical protein HDV05_000817 [Chytridiales sp. JEL 0842]|nr:hypothetical protein HDV05_000817 [Chytridiales sp. JEL 0842]
MEPPDPLASMYTRSYYRASWLLTSVDAGFLTAHRLQPKFLRDFLSIVFSIFFIFFPDEAEETVRKFRSSANSDLMRVSWNKVLNPYLSVLSIGKRGYLRHRRDIEIPRPTPPSPTAFHNDPRVHGPIKARLYYSGTKEELAKATSLILDFPGGGFVAMSPRVHEDYLSTWARQTKVPIVAIDYAKAPEYPYPFAIEQCFDAYRSIVESNGAVIGMDGWYHKDAEGRTEKRKDPIRVVVVGDSAGGNFAAAVTLRCLDTKKTKLKVPAPDGVILIYPCLEFDLACWMPQQHLGVLRTESTHSMSFSNILETRQNIKLNEPLAVRPAPRRYDVINEKADWSVSWYRKFLLPWFKSKPAPEIHSSLSMTSRMSYFNDRMIPPELLRGMALMYLAASPVPINFQKDYYLSPVHAPDELLARFPKTYLICGEKDPLVDDTVVFAGRLREAKARAKKEWERMRDLRAKELEKMGVVTSKGAAEEDNDGVVFISKRTLSPFTTTKEQEEEEKTLKQRKQAAAAIKAAEVLTYLTDDEVSHHLFHRTPDEMVHVKILEGMSHGILQMMAVLPEAQQVADLIGDWALDVLDDHETLETAGGSASGRVTSDGDQALTDYLMEQFSHGHHGGAVAHSNAKSALNGLFNGIPSSVQDSPSASAKVLPVAGPVGLVTKATLSSANGSPTSSPKPGRPVRTIAGEIPEHKVLETRRKALASKYDIQ